MSTHHPQENIIKTYQYKGIAVDLVEWSGAVRCGEVGYAANYIDEPNVERIMAGLHGCFRCAK